MEVAITGGAGANTMGDLVNVAGFTKPPWLSIT